MKAKLIMIACAFVVLAFGMSYGQSFSLESTDGLYNTDSLTADGATPVVFYIRMSNLTSNLEWQGITNGFRIYSPTGATWNPPVGDTLDVGTGWKAMFDLVYAINYFSIDGAGADTIGFGGARLFAAGLPIGFDQVSYSINIGAINSAFHGGQICIDSSYYPPTGTWKWATGAGISEFPSWDGPHCFTLVDPTQLDVTLRNDDLPTSFDLSQNYPNPFNPTTDINFDIPTRSRVTLDIFNVLGQKVKSLVDEDLAPGNYSEQWDGTSDNGAEVSSGVYFYRIQAGSFVETKKMMLLK